MGPIHYQPAVPRLIPALKDEHPGTRGGAAWSLGLLLPPESIPALEQALTVEENSWAKNHMNDTLIAIAKSLIPPN